jgi:hypothetical protein
MDAIARYCAASAAGDMDALMETLADECRVVSPISGRMVFRGRDDLRHLLGNVYAVLSDLRWTEVPGPGPTRLAIGDCRILGIRLTDAMVFDLAPDGRIAVIRPHLRPWLALTVFAALLGPRVARRPGVVRRALRG